MLLKVSFSTLRSAWWCVWCVLCVSISAFMLPCQQISWPPVGRSFVGSRRVFSSANIKPPIGSPEWALLLLLCCQPASSSTSSACDPRHSFCCALFSSCGLVRERSERRRRAQLAHWGAINLDHLGCFYELPGMCLNEMLTFRDHHWAKTQWKKKKFKKKTQFCAWLEDRPCYLVSVNIFESLPASEVAGTTSTQACFF